MKKYILKTQLFLLAAIVSGCSTLDMRCDNVSDRVGMHAGSEWYVYPDTSMPAAEERQEAMALDSKATEDEEPPPVSMYCADHGRARQKTRLDRLTQGKKATSASAEDAVPAEVAAMAANVMTLTEVEDKECKWKESGPRPGEAVNVTQAKKEYLFDKSIRLGHESVTLANGTKRVRIHLINEGLNCAWSSPSLAGEWPCEEINYLPLKPQSDENPEVLEHCFSAEQRPKGRTTNYIGVVDRRFCLFLSLYEVKPEDPKFENKMEDDWYTEISHDRLKGVLRCAEHDGDVQPGVVVGGPRLFYRVPTAVETQASPKDVGQMP